MIIKLIYWTKKITVIYNFKKPGINWKIDLLKPEWMYKFVF